MQTPHSHPAFFSGTFIPAAPQLKPPTAAAEAVAAFFVGLGASQAIHFSFSFGLLVPQSPQIQTSDEGAGGGAKPEAAQLNPPEATTGGGGGAEEEEEEEEGVGLETGGRGSSQAMHLALSRGDLVPQTSQVQISEEGLGGGAIPAEAQLNPPATGAGAFDDELALEVFF